jgi:hypothetical protein
MVKPLRSRKGPDIEDAQEVGHIRRGLSWQFMKYPGQYPSRRNV